ncbi:MAG TPA: molybdate ABC transporter substrate-binding protein [Bryobacteraceae bacterium]|nr:molybdate ABC transporter substrate-binding protein [Bryobacteraceae bacterium]
MSVALSSCFLLLTVAAASDLSPVQPALQKAQPNLQIRFVTAASSVLSQQIENGAPYDIFLSANAQFVDQLASNGKLRPDSVRVYATGRLAILWSDKKSHPVSDLTQNWVRFVALANPRLAPYGAAAQQALQHAGLWTALKGKIVYGENVRQALQLFDSGNAEAVLTALSLVNDRKPDLIPADWHSPIVQKAGIVSASKSQPDADAFMRFLTSPAGQAIFAKFGFGPAKP